MKKRLIIIFLFCCVAFTTQAQPLFGDGARVCFVGNSITHNGEFHHNIMQYFVTRHPAWRISFFNTGIAGDGATHILKRLEYDVLINKPTHAVLMVGMNDVGRGLYRPYSVTNSDTLKLREAALNRYTTLMDSLVQQLLKRNIRVILQTPTIYDQTADLPAYNNFGVNDALGQCAEFVQATARKYGLIVVDYRGRMLAVNGLMQRKNRKATIVGPDRVHPGSTGHFLMADCFIKKVDGTPKPVEIVVAGNLSQTRKRSKNCSFSRVKFDKNGVEFLCREAALPFVLRQEQASGDSLTGFAERVNRDLLRVICPTGRYRLTIDSVEIGNFSQQDLAAGIRLSRYHQTPQCLQSEKVNRLLAALWDIEAGVRGKRYVEYWQLRNFAAINDTAATRLHVAKMLGPNPDSSWMKKQLAFFLKYQQTENAALRGMEELRRDIFRAAQPVEHLFSIKKTD